MKKNDSQFLLINRDFEPSHKVELVIAYLNNLYAQITRRAEFEYHILLSYSTIVAGIFVLVAVVGNSIALLPWFKIGLTILLGVLGIINIVKISSNHRIYDELGNEIYRIQHEMGYYEKEVYVKCEPLCRLSPGFGKGPGYLMNILVIIVAALLGEFAIWFSVSLEYSETIHKIINFWGSANIY